jgi:glycine cleavage system H protein
MSNIPENLLYSDDHEWVLVNKNTVKVGITDHAQDSLGDVVFVELPQVGDSIAKGDIFGTVESVKAASDIYAPVSGKVVNVNQELFDRPELVNESPYEEAWMIEVEIDDKSELKELLGPEQYEELLKGD